MKKLTMSIVALMTSLVMALSLTACGASPEEKLANYIESETFQTQLDSIKSSFESVMDIDVKAEENKVIFEYKYKTQVDDATVVASKTQIDSAFQSMSSTFEGIADTIKEEVGVENPVVVIIIFNADGSEITSVEFGTSK